MSELALRRRGGPPNLRMVTKGKYRFSIAADKPGPETIDSYKKTIVVSNAVPNIKTAYIAIDYTHVASGNDRGTPCIVVFLDYDNQRQVTINDIEVYKADDFSVVIGTFSIDCKIVDPGETFHGTTNNDARTNVMVYYDTTKLQGNYFTTRLQAAFLGD